MIIRAHQQPVADKQAGQRTGQRSVASGFEAAVLRNSPETKSVFWGLPQL